MKPQKCCKFLAKLEKPKESGREAEGEREMEGDRERGERVRGNEWEQN